MFVVIHGDFPKLKSYQLRAYLKDAQIKHAYRIILYLLNVVIPYFKAVFLLIEKRSRSISEK
jgi:hypothetical protein